MQDVCHEYNRLLVRYENRKLYDTVLRRYITMDDVLDLIVEDIPFVVLAKDCGTDHTLPVLIRMLWSMAYKGAPISEGTLRSMLKELALQKDYRPLIPDPKQRNLGAL